ncbi:MAG: B12-binding domain-containing radical SAM protein [Endomicrobiales bacterium]|nr:B12-binding domain-containing radical SAM protein [Endomicrobiales bacterium]
MKVQLLFSPFLKDNRRIFHPMHTSPPLGILYIAAYIRKFFPGLSLKITDGALLGWKRAFEEILIFKPDVLMISFTTCCAISAFTLINKIKSLYPSIKVILGGPHVSAIPDEPFERSACDVVVIGEGERVSLELLNAISQKKSFDNIDGIIWRSQKGIVKNKPPRFISNIDNIPFPARDLIDLKQYKNWYVSLSSSETSVLSSRGCPYDCTPCANSVWKSAKPHLRLRSPANYADELEVLKKEYGINEVFDMCDEFNSVPEHAIDICKEIKKRNLNMTWKTLVRAWPLPEELVRLMAESGCWHVNLGIESGNQSTLDGIKKGITIEQVEQACALFKKYGIKVCGNIMFYNVWEEGGKLYFENEKDSLNTLAFAKKLVKKHLLSYTMCNITTPYPGSRLYQIAKKNNLIQTDPLPIWDEWPLWNGPVMKLPSVNPRVIANTYFRGNFLGASFLFKSGHWRFKHFPIYFGRILRCLGIIS